MPFISGGAIVSTASCKPRLSGIHKIYSFVAKINKEKISYSTSLPIVHIAGNTRDLILSEFIRDYILVSSI
jgi:hypothetical protein